MKNKLIKYLLGLIGVSLISITILLGLYVNKYLKQFSHNHRIDIINQINANLNSYYAFMDLVNTELDGKGRETLRDISKELNDKDSYDTPNLNSLCKKYNLDEIYIIDHSTTITATTFKPDQGLNLGAIDSSLKTFLDSIYGKGQIRSHYISLSTQTGKVNKYFYYSPLNSNYIIQTSYDVHSYITDRFGKDYSNFLFQHFLDSFLLQNKDIKKLDIVEIHDGLYHSFITEEKITPLPKELYKKLKNNKSVEVYGKTHNTYYHFLERPDRKDVHQFHPSQYIELQMNNQMLPVFWNTFIFQAMFYILAFTIFAFFILNQKLTKGILSQISRINKAINLIEKGQYAIQLTNCGYDELDSISKNINKMALVIQNRNQDIWVSHKKIEVLKNQLADILENLPEILISIDQDGHIQHLNRAARAAFHLQIENCRKETLWEMIPTLIPYQEKILGAKEPIYIERESVCAGDMRWINLSIIPISIEQPKGFILKIDDMTFQEEQGLQLLQAQKMETIGNLAGGLAHDFNNILSGIMGTLSLLKFKLEKYDQLPTSDLKKYISVLSDSNIRAQDIVNNLLTLSRKKEFEEKQVCLQECLKNVLTICKNTFDKRIQIERNLLLQNVYTKGDRTQLEQVFLNICVNASHAMTIMREENEPVRGTLKVNLQPYNSTDAFAERYTVKENTPYWLIEISDTGVGIDHQIQEKIFDPFFTTKKEHDGTGLGLSMVFQIIKQHQGILELDSQPGKGTVFQIYLKKHNNSKQNPDEKSTKTSTDIQTGEGVILVVDDEEIIRITATELLKSCGYSVICATNGVEALEVLEQYKDTIQLILLDLVMPELDGESTFRKIQQKKIKVPVLFSSGFKNDQNLKELLVYPQTDFIKKPYSFSDLSRKIKPLLSRESRNK